MLPTLQIGDYVLVNKLRYGVRLPGTRRWLLRFGMPQPGDIIVVHDPKDPSLTYVKRVVALAGEVVEIRDKQVLRQRRAARRADGAYFATALRTCKLRARAIISVRREYRDAAYSC